MNEFDNILDYDESDVSVYNQLTDKGTRFANWILDMVIINVMRFTLLSLIPIGINDDIGVMLFLFCFFALPPLYYFIFETFYGKTPSKFLTKTKVVDINRQIPNPLQILGRTASRYIPFEPFSFFGSSPMGWHDSFSKTFVIDENKM